jgi:AraC family transcriptional activator of mtrCDE
MLGSDIVEDLMAGDGLGGAAHGPGQGLPVVVEITSAKSQSVGGKTALARTATADHRPLIRIAPADLDSLISSLEVQFVRLAECFVSPGFGLLIPATDFVGIHYSALCSAKLIIPSQAPIYIKPHTLVVIPPGTALQIEAPVAERRSEALKPVEADCRTITPGRVNRFAAGEIDPDRMMICGCFRATFGITIDLFSSVPIIVEEFAASDELGHKLKSAVAELAAQDVGMAAVTTALLKQVLIALLRRSLISERLWVERFSILSDPQVARAFAQMASQPGAPHSVRGLAQSAGLSRSAFMTRFAGKFGRTPMEALRELRMRSAATLLKSGNFSIDQVAYNVGYASRSSFLRAFRNSYGDDPSDYRELSKVKSGSLAG